MLIQEELPTLKIQTEFLCGGSRLIKLEQHKLNLHYNKIVTTLAFIKALYKMKYMITVLL